MIVVTVARKPLAESTVASNVLEEAAGGLNIDGSRVGTGEVIFNHGRRGASNGWSFGTSGATPAHQSSGQRLGRWPANLVLSHLPGCRETEEYVTTAKKVHAEYKQSPDRSTGFLARMGAKYAGSTPEYHKVWDCVPGCPVAEMDEQSGQSKSTPSAGGTHHGREGYSGLTAFKFHPPTTHSDSGGASRFFKKV